MDEVKFNHMGDIDRPEDIDGVGDACEYLGVNLQSSDAKIKNVFNHISEHATGEQWWTAVKAQEIALSGSYSTGSTTYTVLRENVVPEDISSPSEAQSLLNSAPPPQDTHSLKSYNRAIEDTADEVQTRLRELSGNPEFEVSESNILAIRVAHFVLHFQDLEEGKRYVLGPDG